MIKRIGAISWVLTLFMIWIFLYRVHLEMVFCVAAVVFFVFEIHDPAIGGRVSEIIDAHAPPWRAAGPQSTGHCLINTSMRVVEVKNA